MLPFLPWVVCSFLVESSRVESSAKSIILFILRRYCVRSFVPILVCLSDSSCVVRMFDPACVALETGNATQRPLGLELALLTWRDTFLIVKWSPRWFIWLCACWSSVSLRWHCIAFSLAFSSRFDSIRQFFFLNLMQCRVVVDRFVCLDCSSFAIRFNPKRNETKRNETRFRIT